MARNCRKCMISMWQKRVQKRRKAFFTTFPLDENRCKEWIKVVGNPELVYLPIEKLNKVRFLCGDHFVKKHFNKKGNRLRKTAVPQLKLTLPPLTEEQLKEFPCHVQSYQKDKIPGAIASTSQAAVHRVDDQIPGAIASTSQAAVHRVDEGSSRDNVVVARTTPLVSESKPICQKPRLDHDKVIEGNKKKPIPTPVEVKKKMDKAFEIQRQARDNVKTLKTYLTDLQNWEVEMKRKEAALNGEFEQDLPPVRSKAKKEKPVEKKKTVANRIASSDYKSWDSFDADKACEEIDMEDVGPTSLDGKKSQQAKMEKLREEAHHEKERGNSFVKQEKWDEAIACYNRAIELVKDDAIYFANRGLCYLKKDSLHQAETDCTEALRLDPTYVKALQRRATARERLGSLRAASHDLNEVLKYEPHNAAARKQLEVIKNRMGTKGSKSKCSPSSTPTSESKPFPKTSGQPRIVELTDEPAQPVPELSEDEKWMNGVGEAVMVIKPVKKPPHLRSKRQLKSVPIQEIPLGKTEPEKPPTRLKIIEIEDNLSQGDTNNNDSNKAIKPTTVDSTGDMKSAEVKGVVSPESEKLVTDVIGTEKDVSLENMVAPVNSVQFMAEWKYLKGNEGAASDYLSIIDPQKIPSIFANALESDVLSDFLRMLAAHTSKFANKSVTAYLKGLTRVKRFSALAMFLSADDKQILNKLLHHCKTAENCSENDISDLKNKFEL